MGSIKRDQDGVSEKLTALRALAAAFCLSTSLSVRIHPSDPRGTYLRRHGLHALVICLVRRFVPPSRFPETRPVRLASRVEPGLLDLLEAIVKKLKVVKRDGSLEGGQVKLLVSDPHQVFAG